MNSILRISEAASLAIHTMVFIACKDGKLVSTREIASKLNASHAHLSKILQRLVRTGLIQSTRGPKGGFGLCQKPEEIKLLRIFEDFEGTMDTEDCLFADNRCRGSKCLFGNLLHDLHSQAYDYFDKTTLDKLTDIF